ncbi:Acyltransferase family protein [Pseudomonas fluorescens]|nr:Acyltransferase family protein [Pseudomonas fluorescens]
MIKNIQYLRFLAAFLVILAHADLQIYGVPAQITNMGGFGVDIFFIISGFIMPFILYGGMYKQGADIKMSAGKFLSRRIIRIWPMYFITILAVAFFSILIESGTISNPSATLYYFFNHTKLEPRWILETLTFTHWSRPPLLNIGWTLQYEFIFYSVMALVILLKSKKLESLEIGLFGIFFFLSMLNVALGNANGFIKTVSSPIIFEFIMGVVLYRTVSSGVLINKYLSIAILLSTIPALIYTQLNIPLNIDAQFYRLFICGSAAFMIVWAALSLEGITKEIKFLGLLGDASYSLYLMHGVVSPLFVFAWTMYGLENSVNIWIYLATYTIVCHTVGIFAHLKIEKPISKALINFTRKERTCAQPSL